MPRYETKWFSAIVPVEFYEYQHVNVGAALRVGPLTIGSDNFLSWVAKGKLEGSDAYVGLRIFPFDEAKSNSKQKANVKSYHSQHKGGGVGCPKF